MTQTTCHERQSSLATSRTVTHNHLGLDLYKRSDWNMSRVWPPLCQCHSDVLHEMVQDTFGNMMKDGVTPFFHTWIWTCVRFLFTNHT
jgi:hypothetical protein